MKCVTHRFDVEIAVNRWCGIKHDVAGCRTRKEYIDILRELRRKHPDMDMPTLESMAASEVLNRGPKSRAFYRIQATRKLTGGGNLIRRKAATDRRDSVIDDTAFATMVDDDVTRLFFEPGHYTVFENVGSFQLTVVRQVCCIEFLVIITSLGLVR